MTGLSKEGQRAVEEIAARRSVSSDAATHLLRALAAGGGRQAQFNHPELGGMGQWSQGGMIMVGDMFNNGLKAKVDALCTDLAALLHNHSPLDAATSSQSQSQSGGRAADGASPFMSSPASGRWPASLGSPASTGSQNDMHYAVFPGIRRLAIAKGGEMRLYDTGDHRIEGFSQQQGGGQSLTFTSQHGLVKIDDLEPVSPEETPANESAPAATTTSARAAQPKAASGSDDDVLAKLEKLAALRDKLVITDEEFAAKKAELLARL